MSTKKDIEKSIDNLRQLGIAMRITKVGYYTLFDEFCKHCPDRRKVRNKNEYMCKHSDLEDGLHEYYCRLVHCPCLEYWDK